MAEDPKLTAVLVVHGMGVQRPLETLRGVIDAVWRPDNKSRQVWAHPERSGTDIDLPIITTSDVPHTVDRRIDFHELYWSHLMSETRAVAVLLWLFELGRKGPRFDGKMQELWWFGAIYLQLLLLSVSLLSLQAMGLFVEYVGAQFGQQDERPSIAQIVPLGLLLMFLILATLSVGYGALRRNWRLVRLSLLVGLGLAVAAGVVIWFARRDAAILEHFLPSLVALLASVMLMGKRWGFITFALTYALSAGFEIVVWWLGQGGAFPWSMQSQWCTAAAIVIIAVYLVVNAAFLQPYLGDAARYFRNAPSNVAVRREIRRQAVNTLEALHLSGKYDRIVVVAHSLGTAVAYDMLRAYYGRICRALPDCARFGQTLNDIDAGNLPADAMREKGRALIAEMAKLAQAAGSGSDIKVWLVTDFVTLGSPLTHARDLVCDGRTDSELKDDCARRIGEREWPTCPPTRTSGDGWLTFTRKNGQRSFHHGGMFAMTRWTNIYFPVREIFWGDAIGGPVQEPFGTHVFDVPVSIDQPGQADFFTHVTYWDIERTPHLADAPHIKTLRDAIDLADTGIANRRSAFP